MARDPPGETAALGAWAEAHVPGFGGLRSVVPFGTGQSNPTFRLDARTGTYVLRAKPPGPLLPRAHDVLREARVMAALRPAGVPVPEVLATATDAASPLGRALFVMAHVEGRVFPDAALAAAGGARPSHFAAMAATLARLHAVDPAAVGLGDLGRGTGYFARQTALWARAYRASTDAPLDDMARAEAWLAARLPEDAGPVRIVHGDFRHDNMIFAPAAPEVRALIDWELATLGPPVADLAYQLAQWRLAHDAPMPGLSGLDRGALGVPDDAGYVALYVGAGGAEPRHWRFAMVFSLFRLAAILAGVARRAADGQGPNATRGRRYGALVPELAALALAEAARPGGSP